MSMKAGHLGLALQLLEQCLKIEPDNTAALINLGIVLQRSGDHRQARESWQHSLEIAPNELAAGLLAESYYRGGDFDKSLALFQQALVLKPNDARYLFHIAASHSHAGSPEVALQDFGRVLAADPGHNGARLGVIRMLAALGRYEEALKRAEQFHQEVPNFEGAAMAVSRILSACPDDRLRDGRRALELARSASEKKKTVASAETLAMAHAGVGEFPQAVEAQKWAVEQLAPTQLKEAQARARKRLELFENNQMCPEPWTADDIFPAITQPISGEDKQPDEAEDSSG